MPQQASPSEMPPSGAQDRRLVLGLGCERGTPAEDVLALARAVLSGAGLPAAAVRLVATLDSRAGEPAMQAASRHFGVPLVTFAAARLEAETPRLTNPSAVVFAHAGCHGVAEAAALAAAGAGGRLVVGKTKSARATVAIAESFQMPGGLSSQIDSAASQSDSNGERP